MLGARVKNALGGDCVGAMPVAVTVTGTFTVTIDQFQTTVELAAAGPLTSAAAWLLSDKIIPGREVTIFNGSASTLTLTNTALGSTPTEGQTVGGSNTSLTTGLAVVLKQRVDGSWYYV